MRVKCFDYVRLTYFLPCPKYSSFPGWKTAMRRKGKLVRNPQNWQYFQFTNFFTYLQNFLKLQSLKAYGVIELSFWNRAQWRQEDLVCTKCFSLNFVPMRSIKFCTNEGTAAESWIFRWRNLRPEFPSLIEFRNHKKSVHIHQNRSTTWRGSP